MGLDVLLIKVNQLGVKTSLMLYGLTVFIYIQTPDTDLYFH